MEGESQDIHKEAIRTEKELKISQDFIAFIILAKQNFFGGLRWASMLTYYYLK